MKILSYQQEEELGEIQFKDSSAIEEHSVVLRQVLVEVMKALSQQLVVVQGEDLLKVSTVEEDKERLDDQVINTKTWPLQFFIKSIC